MYYSKGYRELNPTPHSDKPGLLLGLVAGLLVVIGFTPLVVRELH